MFEPLKLGSLHEYPTIQISQGMVKYNRLAIPVQIANTSNKTFKIRKGCAIGKLSPIVKVVNEINMGVNKRNKDMTVTEFLLTLKLTTKRKKYRTCF